MPAELALDHLGVDGTVEGIRPCRDLVGYRADFSIRRRMVSISGYDGERLTVAVP